MAKITVKIDPADVAERVIDEITYKGKTIREWADALTDPKTRADRVRTMNDEELAELLFNVCCIEGPFKCPAFVPDTHEDTNCRAIWLDWLKSEVEP